MSAGDGWHATVIKKSRALLDGANMYRRLTVRRDDGHTERIRVSRELWQQLEVGDRLTKEAGQEPRRAS